MNYEEKDEIQNVVRKQNRALRRIVRSLRKEVKHLREDGDAKFRLLCDVESDAEKAMRELWESGHYKCGPQDYDVIVEQTIALAALVAMKFEQSAPAQG